MTVDCSFFFFFFYITDFILDFLKKKEAFIGLWVMYIEAIVSKERVIVF